MATGLALPTFLSLKVALALAMVTLSLPNTPLSCRR
jgi:hypothetical protein